MGAISIPTWTKEQFMDEDAPFDWLYQQRGDRYQFSKTLAKVQMIAKSLGVVGFTKMWNEYVVSRESKTVDVTVRATEFPDQPLQLQAGKYRCDETGVSYLGFMGEEIQVISHPLLPVQRLENLDTNEQKIQLAYIRSPQEGWKTVIVPKKVVASAQRIIELAGVGIAVNSENAKEVVKYLSDLESINYADIPLQRAISHMGWLDDGKTFIPYSNNVVYDGENAEGKARFADFRQHGSEQKWMDLVREVRNGPSIPCRIALAASFAAPLIEPTNGLCFFVHFWGTQGCGKTVGLMLAGSVWGRPLNGGYIKTFNATKNSMELNAAFYGNVPVLLDELQTVKDRKVFDDLIYMLCEGFSKGRGSKDGGLQYQRRWKTVFLSTGEMPIIQANSGGGAAVRTIEVNFGGQPFFRDAREASQILLENYGFAGEKFIRALQDENTLDQVKRLQEKYSKKMESNIDGKQLLSASILLAADKLAEAVIFHDGRALTVDDIRPYLITKEAADVNARCYSWLWGMIGVNHNRFEPDQNGERWGVIESDGTVYIIKTIFDRVLQAEGYSPGAFLTWAKRNKRILCYRDDVYTMRKQIHGQRMYCVALKAYADENDTDMEIDPDEMPFGDEQ